MKRFITPILLAIAALLCGVLAFADDKPTGAAIYFNAVTSASGGTFTNADSAPTWTLLKNGTTVVTTGTFTVAGTGTLAADYYGSVTLNSSTFSVGDWYHIEGTATISSVPVKSIVARGRVLPVEPNTGYPALGGGTIGGISGGSISVGTLAVTNGITAATFSISGAASFGSIRDAGSFTVAGLVNSGSLSTGSINSTGIVNTGSFSTGSLNVAGIVDSGTFSLTNFSVGSSNFGTVTGNFAAVSTGTVGTVTNDPSGVTTLLTRLPGVATISTSGTFSIGGNAVLNPAAFILQTPANKLWTSPGGSVRTGN